MACYETISDLSAFASDLAHFLLALHQIDARGGPTPGTHNFFRGGTLSTYDKETREALSKLGNVIDLNSAVAAWEAALESEWSGSPVWVHGDIAPANLLVSGGALCAVIDFGSCAVGDPACDLTIAWTFFSGESRETFRESIGLDSSTWTRARGWALWKAAISVNPSHESEYDKGLRVLKEVIAEHYSMKECW